MKLLFYLVVGLVFLGFIEYILKLKKRKNSGGIKISALIDGKPYKPSQKNDSTEEEKRSRRVDPEEKNGGLNIDTAEKVAWEGNRKIYKTPDGKWFIVYHRWEGELSYQRVTPWYVRNYIKSSMLGKDEDINALLKTHNLTGTEHELNHKEVEDFTPRKYVT